jgi:ribose-phosphate pyrophosphokinase
MRRLIDPLVLSLPSYHALAADLATALGAELDNVERQVFPDGERYHRLLTPVDERDVLLVGGTVDDQHTLDLFDLGCAAVKYGARRLDLIVPYFGYSTMERAVKPREVVTAKTRSRLLSAIPAAAIGNRAWFVDLHSEGIAHYCEGHLVARHIYAKAALLPIMRELGGPGMVLASTDAGRAKWVQSLANELGCDAAIIIKRRLSGSETTVAGVSCDVAGRHVVIYDDMIRTGGSLRGAVTTYQQAGAAQIAVVATHGIFPGDAFTRLQAMPGLEAIACSDSHPRAVNLAADGLRLIPLAGVIADRLADGGP